MNQDRLFAHFLINEVHSRFMMQKMDLSLDFLSGEWKDILGEGGKLEKEVKESGQFFIEGGSIFSDYKELRDSVIPRGQGYMRKVITPKFSVKMSSQEILDKANGIIAEWRSAIRREHEV